MYKKMRMAMRYMKPFTLQIIGLFLILIVSVSLKFMLPRLAGSYLDGLNSGQITLAIPIFYILFTIIRELLNVISTFISEAIGWHASNRMRLVLFRHTVSLDMDYHKKNLSGEIIERIDGDVSFLANFFSTFFINLIGSLLMIGGILVYFYFHSIELGILFTIILAGIMLIFYLPRKKITSLYMQMREAETTQFGYIEEHIRGEEDIRGIGKQEYTRHLLSRILDKTHKITVKARFIGNIPFTGLFTLLNIGDVLSIAIGVVLYLRNDISIGTIYTFISYVGLLSTPIWILRVEIDHMQKIMAAMNRIYSLLDIKSSISSGKLNLLKNSPVSVDLENVSFSYVKSQTVLKNINLHIEKGKAVGVVGKTGSGKTTLMNLLAKLYQTNQGAIRINGTDIREYNLDTYYQSVSFIGQSASIISGTLRENLTYGMPLTQDSEIIKSLYLFGMDHWYKTLKDGLDTVINVNSISAGEAQLIALARLSLQKPSLILLDEITSYVDPKTEKMIQSAIKAMIKERTIIINAHRITTLEIVDEVVALRNGTLVGHDSRSGFTDEMLKELITDA